MVIGHLCGGISRNGDQFRGGSGLAHDLLRKVYERFKDECETVLCRDVRKNTEGGCPEIVGRAARWAAEVIVAEFTDYEPKQEAE